MSTLVGYLIGQRGEFSGARFAIPEDGLVIGRDPKVADLVLDHTMVSRRHAQIAPAKDGKLYLTDLLSRNGTHLNGRKLTAPVALIAGDEIDFGGEGKAVFQFDSAEGAPLTGLLAQVFGAVAAPVEWQPGDTILDLYEVKKVLGQGGMGKVYLVHHKSWNMDLVVKSPLPNIFEDDEGKANFIREAETWVNLNLHPNICQCHYVRTIGGIPRIFAEYVSGGTLAEWIHQQKLTQLDQILDVAIQFAWGLHAAHEQGIVHQDVKPGNVLMTADGISKVSDFGLARARALTGEKAEPGQDLLVSVGGITPAYCSPEQASGKKLTPKSDIWSWALSVLQIFTGGVVWRFGVEAPEVLAKYQRFFGPSSVVPIPKRLQKLLSRCFHLRPEDRPKDMGDIATSLQEIYRDSCHKDYPRPEPKAAEHMADSLNNRALSFLDLGQTEQADHLWQEALRVDPEHLEAVYNSGLRQWRAAQIDDWALAMRLRMASAKTAPPRAALLSSQVELESGDAEAAIELLKAADAADDRFPEATALCVRAQQSMQSSGRCLRTFTNQAHGIYSVCLNRDGRYALLINSYSTPELWEVSTGHRLRSFEGHAGWVRCACLSRDNRYVVSGGGDKTLRLWEVETGRCLRTFEGHTDDVTSVCLSGDSHCVLSGSSDGTLRLWELNSGRCLQVFEGHTHAINSVCLSGDGQYALSGSGYLGNVEGDYTVRLWEMSTGRCLLILTGHTSQVTSVCFSGDSRFALSGSHDHTLRLWDVATGRCLRSFEGHTATVTSVCLSGDNRFALSGSFDDTLRLWEVGTGRCLRTFEGHTQGIASVCLSEDGHYALSGSEDRTLRLWQVSKRFDYVAPWEMCRVLAADKLLAVRSQFAGFVRVANRALSEGNVQEAVVTIKQARALPGHQKTTAALDTWRVLYSCLPKYGLAGGWLEQTFEGHTDRVASVCLSRDGQYALSGSWDKTLRLWEIASGRCLRTLTRHAERISSVCVSDNGQHVLVGGGMVARLLEVNSGDCLQTFEGHTSPVTSVSLSSDGRYALSGSSPWNWRRSRDNTMRLWEVNSGRCLRIFEGHKGGINSVCLNRDNRYVLSGSGETLALGDYDNTMRLWEVATGRCLHTFQGHTRGVGTVSPSWDGRYALSGSSDQTLRLWDVYSGQCVRIFSGHSEVVFSVCLSGDGRYALSGSWDRTVRLWDVATGCCLRVFEGHRECVTSVCLSADGRYALSGSSDKTVRLWALDWELEDKEPSDWDEGARPHLRTFLMLHTPYATQLPRDRDPTDEEITRSLTRLGKPAWTEDDFKALLYTLGCAGYGWLRPEGVRRELEKMAATWQEPPPLIVG